MGKNSRLSQSTNWTSGGTVAEGPSHGIPLLGATAVASVMSTSATIPPTGNMERYTYSFFPQPVSTPQLAVILSNDSIWLRCRTSPLPFRGCLVSSRFSAYSAVLTRFKALTNSLPSPQSDDPTNGLGLHHPEVAPSFVSASINSAGTAYLGTIDSTSIQHRRGFRPRSPTSYLVHGR